MDATIAVHRELKSVERVSNAHKKQLLTYLKLTGLRMGCLLNFGEAMMNNGITRTVSSLQEFLGDLCALCERNTNHSNKSMQSRYAGGRCRHLDTSRSKSGSLPACNAVRSTTGRSESKRMTLGHEKLDVYRLSIGYVAWVYDQATEMSGIHRHARHPWLRASQSIPLNIAQSNGKTADADRRRSFEIARGSALECATIQDVLMVGQVLDQKQQEERKGHLDRIAAMLSTLGGRGYTVKEGSTEYGTNDPDPDPDFDSDFEREKSQPMAGGDSASRNHSLSLGVK